MGGGMTKKKDFEVKYDNYDKKRREVFDKYTTAGQRLEQDNRKTGKQFQQESKQILSDNFKRKQSSVEKMTDLRDR